MIPNNYLEEYEKVIRNTMIAAFEDTKTVLAETGKYDEPTRYDFARQITRRMLMRATKPLFGGLDFEDLFGGKRR